MQIDVLNPDAIPKTAWKHRQTQVVSRRQPVIRLLNGASLVIRASLVVVVFNSVWLESVRLLIGGEDSKDTLVVLVQKRLVRYFT